MTLNVGSAFLISHLPKKNNIISRSTLSFQITSFPNFKGQYKLLKPIQDLYLQRKGRTQFHLSTFA